jgi:branched-chain amino acid transport system permease protein
MAYSRWSGWRPYRLLARAAAGAAGLRPAGRAGRDAAAAPHLQGAELFQLLATFALVLVIKDAALWLWGPEELFGPRAPGLEGSVEILGRRSPPTTCC